MTVHTVDVDGVAIAYERVDRASPDAPWAVLVHGLGYPRHGWGPGTELLAERLRLLLVDNRGIGDSDCPPGPYTAAQMAGDVRAVVADAALGRRPHVIGTSLGGMVAQELAITSSDLIDRMVLVAATPGGTEAAPMPARTQRLLAEAATMTPEEALRRLVANALGPHADASLVDAILELRVRTAQDPAGWQAQAAAGTTYDGGGRAAAITAPTLVLHGTEDAVVDPANGELLARMIPDARLEWFEGAGHLLFWEQPQRFAQRVADFLNS